jgi:hypothetical protein
VVTGFICALFQPCTGPCAPATPATSKNAVYLLKHLICVPFYSISKEICEGILPDGYLLDGALDNVLLPYSMSINLSIQNFLMMSLKIQGTVTLKQFYGQMAVVHF